MGSHIDDQPVVQKCMTGMMNRHLGQIPSLWSLSLLLEYQSLMYWVACVAEILAKYVLHAFWMVNYVLASLQRQCWQVEQLGWGMQGDLMLW